MLGFNILPSYSYLLEKPSEPKKTPIAKLRKIFHLEHFYDGQRTKRTFFKKKKKKKPKRIKYF